jgi:hypothetical protein
MVRTPSGDVTMTAATDLSSACLGLSGDVADDVGIARLGQAEALAELGQ